MALVARSGRPAPPAEAQELYRRGVYAWNRRNVESLGQAIDLFTQAIVKDPSYAAAYAGLADVYNVEPEFGGAAPQDAYPRAKAAAERAVALDPGLAAGHRALGFVEFWWEARPEPALAEFRTALRLDPRSSQTLHWYANALAARGDPQALTEIEAALQLDPSPAVMADRGFALMMLGRYDAAGAVLRQVTALDPDYAPAHAYLYTLAERRGDDPARLDEWRILARLKGDATQTAMVDRAADALAKGGRPAMLQAIAADQEGLLALRRASPFEVAVSDSELRRRPETLSLLRRAKSEHDPSLLSLDSNPTFAWLRTDAAFRTIAPGSATNGSYR